MRIDVLDPQTSERVFSCDGPDLYGGCKRARFGEEIPCAGMTLQPYPESGGLGAFQFQVTGPSPACPLRCLS